ncbi:hypothetical protein BSK66_16265 [Paenibacillus odorifer]|uniref:Copper amine oxidase-like N-terminal domain-containing protein n=1 Tax=Paenibacillus odorifer TaxID=189426 RepID=A0A1R0X028_9BACL|nr:MULTISPECIES: copper amine oxidase N-terminal domain-containing protein [Paenibacillus]ETT55314.1 copper amine oxidase-like protein [Paenibacillus sp. FSL H8-237]OMD25361.1 hypothetical protein BJP51_03660 [Paenibacillus odorifer]OME56396.1 hypothetical protein BSK66_16265 [Paenibacillus odorifer]
MKKLISSLLLLLMVSLMTSAFSGFAASLPLRVVVNGEKVIFPDAQPFIDAQQRVQLPVRFISEALGAKVLWDSKAKKATISLEGKTMGVYIGKKSYELNGKTKQMDTAALFKQSRTFVPLRFVYEGLGVNVKWDDAVKTVYITTPSGEIATSDKPATGESTNGAKTVTIHGFEIPYTQLGANLESTYITDSQLTVYNNDDRKAGQYLFQLTITFTNIGSDPALEAKEAENILRQNIEGDVVDSIMKYVRTKTKRMDELDYKVFQSKDYKIDVDSPGMGDIAIAVWPK